LNNEPSNTYAYLKYFGSTADMYFMEYLNFYVQNTCPGGKLINRMAVWR